MISKVQVYRVIPDISPSAAVLNYVFLELGIASWLKSHEVHMCNWGHRAACSGQKPEAKELSCAVTLQGILTNKGYAVVNGYTEMTIFCFGFRCSSPVPPALN